jgi:endonuclease YncB( thermonuclease family)
MSRKSRGAAVVLVTCFLVARSLAAEELIGVATRVFDGDSFIMRVIEGPEVEVRLGEIDAPEKDQPYADIARSALRGMILDRKLRVVVFDTDRYDRGGARVSCRRRHRYQCRTVAAATGLSRRVKDKSLYDLERAARDKQLGLWALPEADREPPWRWRRTHPRQRNDAPQNVDKPVASISR